MSHPQDTITLNDGNKMPIVGLGTFQGSYDYLSVHDLVLNSVKTAVDIGYRLFDTAALYDTEAPIGEALRDEIQEGKIARKDLFVITKLWCTDHRRDRVVPALRKSLEALGFDYIDLYLVHWPIAFQPGDEKLPKDDKGQVIMDDDNADITETWKGMVECKELGLARSIGISNFTRKQIQRLLDSSPVVPACLQVEVNAFFPNTKLVDFCKQHNIAVSCYSPLGKPARHWKKEEDPSMSTDVTLNAIAGTHKKTPAQVALRFLIQRGLSIVPKSITIEHLKENFEIFDFRLSDEEMKSIWEKCCSHNFRVLFLREIFGHSKEYPFDED